MLACTGFVHLLLFFYSCITFISFIALPLSIINRIQRNPITNKLVPKIVQHLDQDYEWTNVLPCRWTHMKQPFCASFLLLTVGGDAVSMVAAQLVGGRVGCGFRTAASRFVVVAVAVLGSPIKRPCYGKRGNYYIIRRLFPLPNYYYCKERAPLSASRNNAVR